MKALLLAVLLAFAPMAMAQDDLRRQEAYDQACLNLTELYPQVLNCEFTTPPIVIISKITWTQEAFGIYIRGEDVVFVHPHAPDRYKVMVHELAHYLMWFHRIDNGWTSCEKEKVVRKVAGHPWGPLEKGLYNCAKSHSSKHDRK